MASRIRMAVEIRNQTSEALSLAGSEITSGSWTPGGWEPDGTIEPGAISELRAEGDLVGVPTSGAEGRVRYRIAGDPDREIYIHFNSPLVESAYGNTFHVWAPPGFDIHNEGGQGHEARLVVTLRPTERVRVPKFIPSVCGLHFTNSWSSELPCVTVGTLWNKLLEQLPGDIRDALKVARADDDWLPFTHADAGMCGGMVFAVMDYYNAHLLPPVLTVSPTSADDPLFIYIRDRLIDSFDIVGGGSRGLAYSAPVYPNGDEGFVQTIGLWRGRSWVTYREAWPQIRNDIDSGLLSPISLVQTDSMDIANNHQVLAYAYSKSAQQVTLWIYDPNHPNENDVRFEFDITNTDGEVHITRTHDDARIFCLYRTDGYNAHIPPSGRPPAAASVNDCLLRATGSRTGVLPGSVPGMQRPVSLRSWTRSF